MSVLDLLISKIAPHDCLACGVEGHLLCALCVDQLMAVPERCYRCHEASQGSLTCVGCYSISDLYRVQAAAIYDGTAKAMIWQLKLAGARAAARLMAKRMACLIRDDTAKLMIVPVPTATSRTRQRGYDQAKLLARELSRQTRLPYRDCLARSGQAHQHGLSRQDRLTQLESVFRVTRPWAIKQANILLVDDVVTTGSTLEAATTVLKAAGGERVSAIVFAQALLTIK